MTDIREAREVDPIEIGADVYARWRQGITTESVPPYLQGPYEVSAENARAFLALITDAWSAAGMTICGEQVGMVDLSSDDPDNCFAAAWQENAGDVDWSSFPDWQPVFVPVLSDPQEGDK